MSNSNKRIYLYKTLVILSLSTTIPSFAFAAPLDVSDNDWKHVNGNSWAWNYSPQNQINKNNVDQLEVKWLFSVGSAAQNLPSQLVGLRTDEGMTAPPLIVDGIVYVLTTYKSFIAIDAKTGKQLWEHQYNLDVEEAISRLPVVIEWIRHSHGFRYWETEDVLLNPGQACDIYAVDAKTGEERFRINDLCVDIEGNIYKYRAYFFGTRAVAEIGTYEKGRQFIYVLPGRIHSNPNQVAPGDARHVTMGINMDTHEVEWKIFSFPPQGVLTKDWALQECSIGFFRDIPCNEVANVNREGLEWDWALPDEAPGWWSGVTGNWGQPVIDEETGILYTQTGNQGPYSNMSLSPGPRLYGSTIMAIDLDEGKRKWWLQPFPHDPYDYDCNWSGMLVDNPTLGKVYIKGCKEGIFYVMDAATGKPKYKVDVRDDQLARGQISTLSIEAYAPDPRSYHDMREWNWISWPAVNPGEPGEHFTLPAAVYPHWSNGVFNTDMSFDPEGQRIILYEGALQVTIVAEHPYTAGNLFTTRASPDTNTTIVARDLVDGEVRWTYYYPTQQRAHMVVSGGMVFTGFTDGYLRFLDKETGKLLQELNLGSHLTVGVTIGKDSNGDSKIVTIAGSGYSAGNVRMGLGDIKKAPGTIIAIGLSDKAAAEVRTTTITTTTTTRTTLTTTSISTTATTSTITSTAQASTTTVTSEVTEETGLPVEITYAAVAVAVIAIVAAAFLMMRKR